MTKRLCIVLMVTLAIAAVVARVTFREPKNSIEVDGNFHLGQEHFDCYVDVNALFYEGISPPFKVGVKEFFFARTEKDTIKLLRYTYSEDGHVRSLSGRMQDLEYRNLKLLAGKSSPTVTRKIFGEPTHVESEGKDQSLYFEPLALHLVFSDSKFVGFSLNEEESTYSKAQGWEWYNPEQMEGTKPVGVYH